MRPKKGRTVYIGLDQASGRTFFRCADPGYEHVELLPGDGIEFRSLPWGSTAAHWRRYFPSGGPYPRTLLTQDSQGNLTVNGNLGWMSIDVFRGARVEILYLADDPSEPIWFPCAPGARPEDDFDRWLRDARRNYRPARTRDVSSAPQSTTTRQTFSLDNRKGDLRRGTFRYIRNSQGVRWRIKCWR